ncbi:MAG: hypothetical protein EBU32_13370, partial [Opitutaceae bacterium]|nr:hypothetical protein [Opitutaceae bacterium]
AIGGKLLVLGAVALAIICLFQLVTLPVEFDASRRAKVQLVNLVLTCNDKRYMADGRYVANPRPDHLQ